MEIVIKKKKKKNLKSANKQPPEKVNEYTNSQFTNYYKQWPHNTKQTETQYIHFTFTTSSNTHIL